MRSPLLTLLITPVLAGVVLTILAPLGTQYFSLAGRAFYWIGLCIAGGLGAGLYDLLNKKFSITQNRGLAALAHSLFATLAVAIFMFSIFAPSSLWAAVSTLFYIWVISITISGVSALMRPPSAVTSASINARPALYDRLAPKLRSAQIYAIASEDHYVRVYTSAGEEMILMRLSDAVKESAPHPGHAPLRPWWVAEAGVQSAKRKNSKTILVLKNGITAPVSRSGAKALKESGWV